ncbi:tRNA (guanosine(46)-N7)-methyltransferase TrmB [Oxalobacter sp. OttesenSCG-928-P03]|nr:tRNA (guanosine(46)-N7)-methyltransferase TrmB [Oxalobacter sp. OttesenSCG-928-P03]
MTEKTAENKKGKPLFYDPTEQRIRSFITRAGRLSAAQERAIHELGPQYCIPFEKKPLDFMETFDRVGETILEIGFGMGETTAQIAESMPEKNFLGVEVHTPGVGSLLKLVDDRLLNNIRIIQHDAVEVISHMIPKGSLDGVHIFFPDPWHKARHNKRRLIQPPFVQLLTTRLKSGGYIHCATDWEPYAVQMLEVLDGEPFLENTAADYAPRPSYRPETKFEKRGRRLGHGVWDLVFKNR